MIEPHTLVRPEGHADEPKLDLRERGAQRDGQPQLLDGRLFMQLLVLDCAPEPGPASVVQKLGASLRAAGVGSVLYEDVNDPFGLGLLTFSEEPADFLTKVRPAVTELGRAVTLRPDFTMLGRTYSSGFEPDLEFWLLKRPRETVLNEAWPWAIWYPLRRNGAFARLEPREQGGILREHGNIGKTYAGADLAHDVRLACHGLDAKDNEFVIGLIGKSLHPLSHVVQAMRGTRQTAEFIAQMGPFFVGRAVQRTPG
ncbi:MAG TPA: chlorite dismutase family protein [Polyangiaceae bacterium]|nr:chlorite dismutase family protein [Polyangiaceae bacterium]